MSTIAIVGSGVVGFATGVGLSSLGHKVTFVDIDRDRLESLQTDGHRVCYIDEMTLEDTDAVFVAVPTPTGEHGVDTSYLLAACKTLGRILQTTSGVPLLVFRSTMTPGTTRNLLIPELEESSGKEAGRGFHVCYNPEYLRAHNAVADFAEFRFLTFGTASPDDEAALRMRELFTAWSDATVTELSFEEAEFQKYVHNVFNAVKISYFNEMRQAAGSLNLDRIEHIFALTAKTAEASWNPDYGIRAHGPFGGACLPKDTAAWAAFSRHMGIESPVVDATRAINISLGGSPA